MIRYEYFYDNDSWKKVWLVQWSPIFQYMENDRHRNRQIAGNRSVIHMMYKPVEHVEVYIGDVFFWLTTSVSQTTMLYSACQVVQNFSWMIIHLREPPQKSFSGGLILTCKPSFNSIPF